jgi:surfactin synthase thioesterase subunit
MEYAKTKANHISLLGCSMGAYFSLLAYENETLDQAIFLSPVVDMERIIQNMMTWFSISEDRLQAEQEIATPIGQPLYWDYYYYVKEHPISHWAFPTDILYGSADNLCERDTIESFAQRFGCQLTIMQEGEHFFHTLEQLAFCKTWLEKALQ